MGDSVVRKWLEERGFEGDVFGVFEDNGIDMDVLKTLTEADLKEIGISSFGVRRKLSIAVKSIHASSEVLPSQPSTPPDAGGTGAGKSSVEETTGKSSSSPKLPSKSANCSATTRKPSFTNMDDFDVGQILQATELGKPVLKELVEEGHLTIASRKKLVQVVVAYLIEQVGSVYPTGPQKLALAKAIVHQYPCTKDVMPGSDGYEHLYHNGHGFIEYRLKTVRAARPACLKRRLSKKRKAADVTPKPSDVPSMEVMEMVEFLKYHPPMPENKTKLTEFFKGTHQYRQHQVKTQSPTLTQILSDWPRLRDMPDLINVDFGLLYPTSQSEFLTKWSPRFSRQLIEVARRQKRPVLDSIISKYSNGDDDLCSLVILVTLLRTTNFRKNGKDGVPSTASSSSVDAVSYLIQTGKNGTDVDLFSEKKNTKYQQPFLLGLGPATNPTEYFIVCDKSNIPAGSSLIVAFDRLFKLHYVCNVHYAMPLLAFYNFVECVVYKVLSHKEAYPQVRSLNVDLHNLSDGSRL